MATTTHRATINSTTNASSYASASFTPTAGDLLVLLASPSGVTAAGSATASANGITFTRLTATATRASVDVVEMFVANQLVPASPSAMTVTYATGAAATGAIGFVTSIAGMLAAGPAVVRQQVGSNQAAGATPAITFGGVCLTGNTVVAACFNATSPATLTPPTSFTERADVGYATPTRGGESVTRNSGHTSATVTWASTSATACATVGIELDTTLCTGAVALAATDTISTAAVVGVVGDVALAATATITATASVAGGGGSFNVDAALAATDAITAAAQVGKVTGATLAATDTITTAGVVGKATGATLAGTATTTATAVVAASTGATLAATATITAVAVVGVSSSATIAATATITAAGTTTSGLISDAAIAAVDVITAAAQVGKIGAVSLAATDTITAAGQVGKVGAVALAAVDTITAVGVVGRNGGATLSGTATITATAVVGKVAQAALAATATITATAAVGGAAVSYDLTGDAGPWPYGTSAATPGGSAAAMPSGGSLLMPTGAPPTTFPSGGAP